MEEKKALNEAELEKVSGGSHLSSDEVKGLSAGMHLIMESNLGNDLAEVEYLGEWRDGFMLECNVKILKILSSLAASYNEMKVGDVMWVSRWNLDFPERA